MMTISIKSLLAHPPEVRSSVSVRGLRNELVDPLEVIGHRLAGVDVRHDGNGSDSMTSLYDKKNSLSS